MKTTKDTKRGTAKRPAAKKTKATARTVAKSDETARDRSSPYYPFSKEELARGCISRTVGEVEDKRAKLLAEQEELLRNWNFTKADTAELLIWLRGEIEEAKSGAYTPGNFYNDLIPHGSIWESYTQMLAKLISPGAPKLFKHFERRVFCYFVAAEYDEVYHKGFPIEEVLDVKYLYDVRESLQRMLPEYFRARAAQVVKTNTKAADLWLLAADKIENGGTFAGEAGEAARLGRIDHERGKLAETVAPSPSGTSAPVGGSAAKPSAIVSKLAGKSLQYTKNGRRLSCVFVRAGKIGGDGGELKRGGKPYPGVTFFFGKFGTQEPLYAESQRTITFTEELIQAFVKRHEGNGDGWAKLPEDVTSRNARTKLFRGWTKSVTDKITYGRGDRKGYARLDLPEVWL